MGVAVGGRGLVGTTVGDSVGATWRTVGLALVAVAGTATVVPGIGVGAGIWVSVGIGVDVSLGRMVAATSGDSVAGGVDEGIIVAVAVDVGVEDGVGLGGGVQLSDALAGVDLINAIGMASPTTVLVKRTITATTTNFCMRPAQFRMISVTLIFVAFHSARRA